VFRPGFLRAVGAAAAAAVGMLAASHRRRRRLAAAPGAGGRARGEGGTTATGCTPGLRGAGGRADARHIRSVGCLRPLGLARPPPSPVLPPRSPCNLQRVQQPTLLQLPLAVGAPQGGAPRPRRRPRTAPSGVIT